MTVGRMTSGAESLADFRREMQASADQAKAEVLKRFFKTGPGEYARGDRFLGITVPVQRRIAKKYAALSLADLQVLLKSPWHEERLTALLILVAQFRRPDPVSRAKIYQLYLRHTARINNWDLVDLTAPDIVGGFLEGKDKGILSDLARSPLLWERRIAVLATFWEIKKGRPALTYKIVRLLLNDPHDLIHKAAGWMLREAGKRCSTAGLEDFLIKHYPHMPRTMLRYAIERFPPSRRRAYLEGRV